MQTWHGIACVVMAICLVIGVANTASDCHAAVDASMLQPQPQYVLFGPDRDYLTMCRTIPLVMTVTDSVTQEAEVFSEQMHRLLNWSVKIAGCSQDKEWPVYAAILSSEEKWRPDAFPQPPDRSEGYTLSIGKSGIVVAGHDRQGLFYGLQTLLQMFMKISREEDIPSALIVDWPDIPNRAILMNLYGIRRDSDLTYFKRLLSAMAALKYNSVFFQFDFAIPGPSSPFPVQMGRDSSPLTDVQVRELCNYARRHHLEVNLAFQFGGHCVWLLAEPAYSTFGEYTERSLAWPNANWSPANPELWTVINDLVSHQIGLFKPRKVHVGHDEMAYGEFNTSPTSVAAGLSNEELAAHSFNELRKIIPSDVEMISWFDMFMPEELKVEQNRGFVDSDKMLELTPQDLALNLWFYDGSPAHLPAIKYFRQHDRCYWVSTFHAKDAARVCYYGSQYDATGVLGTHWYEVGGWLSPRTISNKALAAVVATAVFSWNAGQIDNLSNTSPVRLLHDMTEGPAEVSHYGQYECLDISSAMDDGDQSTTSRSLLALILGEYSIKHRLDDTIPFMKSDHAIILAGSPNERDTLPVSVTIPIDKKVKAVHLLHTCGLPSYESGMTSWQKAVHRPIIGGYTLIVSHEDTEERVEIPLEYGWNIQNWNALYGPYSAPLAWVGSTSDGIRVQAQRVSWKRQDNKRAMTLKAIEFNSQEAYGIQPALLGITLESPADDDSQQNDSAHRMTIMKDDFEYDSTQALQESWDGYDAVRLETDDVKAGTGALACTIPAGSELLRYNIGKKDISVDISKANLISFRIKTARDEYDDSRLQCALYFGKDDAYWYRFGFHLQEEGQWEHITIPFSLIATEGDIPESGGMTDLNRVMFSFWRTQGRERTILLDDFVVEQKVSPDMFNRYR